MSEATSVVDLADKYADALESVAKDIPVVGAEVPEIVGLLDEATKALNALNAALAAA